MKLVLFDIDGTILNSMGNGKRAMIEAARKHSNNINENIIMAGSTDLQIVLEMLNGSCSEKSLEGIAEKIFSDYIKLLKLYYKVENGITLIDGVKQLIEALSIKQDIILGLLTGNIKKGAEIKLLTYSLYHHFPFGAFGDEALYRKDLPEIAVKRAYDHTGISFKGKDIIIIGDTVHDILCGKHLGVTTIVVDSGFSKYEDIMNAKPDYYCKDFLDYKSIIKFIDEI